jgi:large subunit ribosomal protein L23
MNNERLSRVLLTPVVSEKSAAAADDLRQYVFKVLTDATKREISKAVEKMFDVRVEKVQVVKVKGKQKRFGRMLGRRADWKKAYVKLQPGYDIQMDAGA